MARTRKRNLQKLSNKQTNQLKRENLGGDTEKRINHQKLLNCVFVMFQVAIKKRRVTT